MRILHTANKMSSWWEDSDCWPVRSFHSENADLIEIIFCIKSGCTKQCWANV